MKRLITVFFSILTAAVSAQNQKISEMTPAASLSGSEFFPVLQSSVNKKATISQIPLQGDAQGTVLNVVVKKLQGYSYAATSPSNGQVYAFNTSTLRYEPVSVSTLESDPSFTSLGVQKTLTITINGVAQDLSTNRSWTVTTSDGDKGAIVVSSGGTVWLLDANSVGSSNITDGSITNSDLANNSIGVGVGTGGTEPAWSYTPVPLGGTATINIPNANGIGVTRGVISKTDYDKIIAAYGWGNHATYGYLTTLPPITVADIVDMPPFITGYTETDPTAVKTASFYSKPTWLTEIDYSIIDNAPVIVNPIPYKAGTNVVFSAGTGDTIIISSVAGGGGGGGSIVSVGLSAPTGMSGGSAVTGAGGTLNLTLTLGAGNVRSNGSGGFVIGNINLASEVSGVLPAANGGLPIGDNGDITVSSATVWNIDANAVGTTEIANGAVTNAKLANSSVGQTVTTASGTAPAYSSSTTALGASTQLAIPMALNTGVTAGLISKVDYDKFNTAYGWGNHATAGYLTAANAPPFSDANNLIKNASDATKTIKISAANVSAGQSRVLTAQNANYTLAGLDIVQTFTAPQYYDAIMVLKSGSFIRAEDFFSYLSLDGGDGSIVLSSPSSVGFGVNGNYVNVYDSTCQMSQLKGALSVPAGTTAERPNGTGSNGDMRYNTSSQKFEFKQAGTWINISTGTGAGTVTQVTASEPGSTAINLEVTNQTTTPNVVLTYNGDNTEIICGDGSMIPIPTTTIADGDKGDIVVSGSGSVWSVQNSTITNAKLLYSSFGHNVGTSGLSPSFTASYTSLGGSMTLNIPLAAASGVLAGLVSKAKFDQFNSAAYDVSAISGTGNAEAASISGGFLTMHPATATTGGITTTGNQTWDGRKTLLKPLRLPLYGTTTNDPSLLFGTANDHFGIWLDGPGDHSGSEYLKVKSGAGANDYVYFQGGNFNAPFGTIYGQNITAAGNLQTLTFTPNSNNISADHTLTDGEMILLVDATSGNKTITIPALYAGGHVTVKKIDATANTVTIDPEGSIDIEFASTSVLSTQGQTVVIIRGDSGDWYKIN